MHPDKLSFIVSFLESDSADSKESFFILNTALTLEVIQLLNSEVLSRIDDIKPAIRSIKKLTEDLSGQVITVRNAKQLIIRWLISGEDELSDDELIYIED